MCGEDGRRDLRRVVMLRQTTVGRHNVGACVGNPR
jgi:hypothetical protein